MRTEIRQINSTWSEKRFYDENDKLIEIRTFASSGTPVVPGAMPRAYSPPSHG